MFQFDYRNDRLSILYAILAWNAAGFVMYQCYHGRADWPKALGLKTEQEEATPPAVYYSEILGIQNMKVKRISGFQVVDEYEIKDGIRVKKTEEESSST